MIGRRQQLLAVGAPALLAALALSACGSTFDSKASGENLLKSWVPGGLSQYAGRPLVLKAVNCPSGVKITVGGTYVCKITLGVKGTSQTRSGTVTIHIQQKTVGVAPSDVHLS